ncbi:cyclin-dependent kinase 2-associated protein 1-like isoform X2 [Branchiostoma floridae x Branchiostoma belcheri]
MDNLSPTQVPGTSNTYFPVQHQLIMASPAGHVNPSSLPALGGLIPGAHLLGRGGPVPQSKYAELLAVIEDLGKDIRPTYAGSKSSTERLKRGIIHARALVRECLMETERSARS